MFASFLHIYFQLVFIKSFVISCNCGLIFLKKRGEVGILKISVLCFSWYSAFSCVLGTFAQILVGPSFLHCVCVCVCVCASERWDLLSVCLRDRPNPLPSFFPSMKWNVLVWFGG